MNRKIYPFAITVGLALSLLLAGCIDPAVADTMKAIDSIGTVTIESKDAIDAANEKYNSLDKDLKKEVDNYSDLNIASKRYDQLLCSEIT